MNSVVISGRLTRDPELRHTPSGASVCMMGLAVDRAGQKQDDGEIGAGFFNVEVWGDQGENAAKYLDKGSRVAFQGELRFRQWEAQDGSGKRTAVEVTAFRVEYLETKTEAENRRGGGDGQQTTSAQPREEATSASDFGAPADDDIPF